MNKSKDCKYKKKRKIKKYSDKETNLDKINTNLYLQ